MGQYIFHILLDICHHYQVFMAENKVKPKDIIRLCCLLDTKHEVDIPNAMCSTEVFL